MPGTVFAKLSLMAPTPAVSVILPAYNECFTIREILRRVFARPEVSEVVVIDDGSTDGTREILEGLRARYASHAAAFRLIAHDKNEGKGSALADGFKAATGEILIIQDADLEYNPEDYPRLIAPIVQGKADAVYGSRFLPSEKRALLFWHQVANTLLTLACNVFTNLNLTDVWTGYKAFRADVVKKIPFSARHFEFEPEMTIKMARLGCSIYEVPIRYSGRTYAEGKKITFKDALSGAWMMLKAYCSDDLCVEGCAPPLRGRPIASRHSAYVAEQYRPYLGATVIEIGAGSGNSSRFLLDRERLTLTDADPAPLRRLSALYGDWGYVEVAPLDILEPGPALGERSERYDSVVCSQVLEFIDDDVRALSHMRRLLRPQGTLVLSVAAHSALYGPLDRKLGHLRRYDAKGLEEKLKKAGFEPVQSRFLDPISALGWWFNGKLLRRKSVPEFQIALIDRLLPLVRRTSGLLPFGIFLLTVAKRR